MLKTVRSGSQFSGCPQSERTASVCEHGLGHVECSLSLSDLFFSPPPSPPDMPWLFSESFPLLFADKVAKLPEGLGDRVWLPKCPVSGMIWRETRICVSFPFPQACPFAAMWVDLDTLGFAKWAETPKVFPKSNRKGPSWRELKTRKEVARALTSEHCRCSPLE